MITSRHNPRVQWIRALQKHSQRRQEENAFVVEGIRLAEEALQASVEIYLACYAADLDNRGNQLIEQMHQRHVPLEEVSPPVLKAISDTETPQGIVLVVKRPELPIPASPNFVFLPDQIRDPGNLGTMLRSAAAAGVELVLLPPGTVDVFSPKVVRSAMGAHFFLPMRQMNWQEIEALVYNQRLQVFLADVKKGIPYTQADFRTPLMLIIGGEAEGASSQGCALANQSVFIPMPGKAESLNAAAAATVLLFEIVRQRGVLR